jgi:hypothetical protein
MLQTTDHTRAAVRLAHPDAGAAETDRRMALRTASFGRPDGSALTAQFLQARAEPAAIGARVPAAPPTRHPLGPFPTCGYSRRVVITPYGGKPVQFRR